jgi:hypothetical protein
MTADAVQELEAMKVALTALEKLDAEARGRAMKWLAEALGIKGSFQTGGSSTTTTILNGSGENGGSGEGAELTPKQFMALKRPTTDVERIACLAFYLTHFRSQPHFKTVDLTNLNTEAAGHRFGNASQAAQNAMTQNDYITQAGKGNRQITARGEALVNALPDREAVTSALADYPKKRRAAAKKKPAAKKS